MANIYQGATIQDAQAILDRLAAKAREVTGQTVSPEPGDAASLMDRARYDRYAGDLDKAASDFYEQYLRRAGSHSGIVLADSTALSKADPYANPERDFRELGAELQTVAAPHREDAPLIAPTQGSTIAPTAQQSGPATVDGYFLGGAYTGGTPTPLPPPRLDLFGGVTPPAVPQPQVMQAGLAGGFGGLDTTTLMILGIGAVAVVFLMTRKGK